MRSMRRKRVEKGVSCAWLEPWRQKRVSRFCHRKIARGRQFPKRERERAHRHFAVRATVAKNEFVNSVAECETLYSPRQLLECISQIEKDGDRVRLEKWGDRTLDIDVLFFGDEVIELDDLCVPHPDMQNRLFVLQPLCELLIPTKCIRCTKKRVREMLSELEEK